MTGPEPSDLERRLRALTPRRPSHELRARVLRQAAAGLVSPATTWQLLLESWSFRCGWAVGLAAMVVLGAWSERSFTRNRWGVSSAVADADAANSETGTRGSVLEAALRIESEVRPSDAAALGGGDPNRCDRDRARSALAAADAHPRHGPDPSHSTGNRATEGGRRLA